MCGVIGLIIPRSKENLRATPPVDIYQNEQQSYSASYGAYKGLLNLQHRGQDAVGLMSYDESNAKFYQFKSPGAVLQVVSEKHLLALQGNLAIGHTRYATVGSDELENLQPMVTSYPYGLAMVHNGNILNYYDLSRKLKEEKNIHLLTQNDLELILELLAHNLLASKVFSFDALAEATNLVMQELIGGYAVVGMVASYGLFAFRDPLGIRPLIQGKNVNGEVAFASESIALESMGHNLEMREVLPGELIFIDLSGKIYSKVLNPRRDLPNKKLASCMFEWIYFARSESKFGAQSVYGVRFKLGKLLAQRVFKEIQKGTIAPEVVACVPDTARTAAIALADGLKIPFREILIKNRYVQRSFILKDQQSREKAVLLKLAPVEEEIRDRRILLVDDSIVRGTTSKQIIKLLKDLGAKEIVLGITCPPVRYGCFYGIDFPDPRQLLAYQKELIEIEQYLKVDRVIFLLPEDLKEAISSENLCMACVNGDYPTPLNGALEFATKRKCS